MGNEQGGTDLNIAAAAAAGGNAPSQTQTPKEPADAGDGNPADAGGSGTGGGAGASDGGGAGDGDTNPETGKPWTAEEWRDKFRHSAAGAQELLTKTKTLTSELENAAGKIEELEKEKARLRELAEGKNPDGLKAADIQDQLAKTSQELVLMKEETALDKFERANPLATGTVRESLKSLARANPKASLQQLWDENLRAGAEAAEARRVADDEKRKNGAGDRGKGTSTRDPGGKGETVRGLKGDTGLSLEEFNNLPVAERMRLIQKHDIR